MICPICQADSYCTLVIFNEVPFVDGKNYSNICFCCASVPNTYEYDEVAQQLHVYSNYSPLHINSVNQMQREGWSAQEAQTSINAVKKLVSKTFEITSSMVFESLILMEGEPLADSTTL